MSRTIGLYSIFSISSLPLVLLTFVLTASYVRSDPQWPYNLPANVRYYPEDEPLVKKGLDSMNKIVKQAPIGVQKMSSDPEEMFYLDYWQFKDDDWINHTPSANQSLLQPPLLVHKSDHFTPKQPWFGFTLYKRDFQCPAGYNSCANLGASSLCCPSGNTCINIQDTGSGSVGCCPSGSSCSNSQSVGSCNIAAGYSNCQGSDNGGCCIPGYSCFSSGCISYVTSTTTMTIQAGTTATTCSSGASSCPASLGGGCCPTSLSCGPNRDCIGASTSTLTTTAAGGTTIIPPVSASSQSSSSTTSDSAETAASPSTTLIISSQTYAVCPQNYYFCSAYYRPGCCQIGRDCATTNCPAAVSSSTFLSNGVTVVIPVGSSTGGSSLQITALLTSTGTIRPSTCAGGWSSCAASLNGGCCPSGYDCGTASCSRAGAEPTGKMNPSSMSIPNVMIQWILLFGGFFTGIGMIVL